jgi:hypothetical protein
MTTEKYEKTYDALKEVLHDNGLSHNDAIGILETVKADLLNEIVGSCNCQE